MNNFLYAMDKSFEVMEKEASDILSKTDHTEEDMNKIFFAVSACLHSIVDYMERVNVSEEDAKWVSAFKYANNSLKHCKDLKMITNRKGGFIFPFHSMTIPKKIIAWSIIDNGGDRSENQRKDIKNFLTKRM